MHRSNQHLAATARWQTRAAPGIEPGTSCTLSKNHATRPSSQCCIPVRVRARALRRLRMQTLTTTVQAAEHGHTDARTTSWPTEPAPRCTTPCHSHGGGLLWELNPGPLAPEARIMPLDQAAMRKWQGRRGKHATLCACGASLCSRPADLAGNRSHPQARPAQAPSPQRRGACARPIQACHLC